MYIPRHFRQDDSAVLHDFIRSHPLATLIVHGGDGFDANHVPLLFDPKGGDHGVLRGHVARANPVWHAAVDGIPALAVFHGPQAYVSPGWYPSKRDDPKVVPTWNYAVVHAHGTLTTVDDPDWLYTLVTALTEAHEQPRPTPWQVTDAPPEFIERMVGAVVGIELTVERLEGKWKLSQNRSAIDRGGVVAGLRDQSGARNDALADFMGAENPERSGHDDDGIE